jgi:hypothetical protein
MAATRNPSADLVASVYEAALEPSLWPQVVMRAAKAFDAAIVGFGVVDRHDDRVLGSFWNDSDFARCVRASYPNPSSSPVASFAARTSPLMVTDGLMSTRETESHDFYNEVMRPRGLWRTMAVNLHRDEAKLAPMALFRERAQPWFDDGELAALRALAPHLNRALRVTLCLREIEARAGALAETSDRALTAIVVTDAFGRVAEANDLARAILAESNGLTVRDGVLRAARSDDNTKLARLILDAASGVDGSTFMRKGGVMQVARPSCRRPLALVVSPTRNAASPFGRSHAVMIAFADPERTAEPTRTCSRGSTTSRRARPRSRRCFSRAARRAKPRTSSQ